jgi:hypothetical protein
MRVGVVGVFLVAFVLGGLYVPQATAIDQGHLGTISPEKTHLELTGTPLAGVFPIQEESAEPFSTFRPAACASVTYCDTMTFEVDYPNSYLRDVFFGIHVQLSWDNPYHSSKNPAGNDVDLFVWPEGEDPALGRPYGEKCVAPNDAPCDEIHPEVVTISEPPNTTPEDATQPAFWITVVNHRGVNTGYELNIDWFTFELPDPPKFEAPERETSVTTPSTEVTGPFDFEVTDDDGAGPASSPRVILVPGPDGKLHEVTLPIYAAGQRLGATAERNAAVPWITAGIIGAICFALLVFYLVRRNRQAMEEL